MIFLKVIPAFKNYGRKERSEEIYKDEMYSWKI
jgi:hypothetical protein